MVRLGGRYNEDYSALGFVLEMHDGSRQVLFRSWTRSRGPQLRSLLPCAVTLGTLTQTTESMP